MMPPQTSEPSVKLGISICRLSTQFHINTVLDRAKNCLFDLIFLDRNMLTSLSSLLAVLPVLDQCIFYQKVLPWIQFCHDNFCHDNGKNSCCTIYQICGPVCFYYNEMILNTMLIKQCSLSALPDCSKISLYDQESSSDHLGLIKNIEIFLWKNLYCAVLNQDIARIHQSLWQKRYSMANKKFDELLHYSTTYIAF